MRSLWTVNIVDKTAMLRVFDFTNRVNRDEGWAGALRLKGGEAYFTKPRRLRSSSVHRVPMSRLPITYGGRVSFARW